MKKIYVYFYRFFLQIFGLKMSMGKFEIIVQREFMLEGQMYKNWEYMTKGELPFFSTTGDTKKDFSYPSYTIGKRVVPSWDKLRVFQGKNPNNDQRGNGGDEDVQERLAVQELFKDQWKQVTSDKHQFWKFANKKWIPGLDEGTENVWESLRRADGGYWLPMIVLPVWNELRKHVMEKQTSITDEQKDLWHRLFENVLKRATDGRMKVEFFNAEQKRHLEELAGYANREFNFAKLEDTAYGKQKIEEEAVTAGKGKPAAPITGSEQQGTNPIDQEGAHVDGDDGTNPAAPKRHPAASVPSAAPPVPSAKEPGCFDNCGVWHYVGIFSNFLVCPD